MPFLTFAHLAAVPHSPLSLSTSCDVETDCVVLSLHSDDGLGEHIFQISLMSIENILSQVVGLPSAGTARHVPFLSVVVVCRPGKDQAIGLIFLSYAWYSIIWGLLC